MAKVIVEMKDNTEELIEALGENMLIALEECGMMAEKYAKKDCRVDTGFLRNSITYMISGNSTAITEYEDDGGNQKGTYSGTEGTQEDYTVTVGTNVEYAHYIEEKDSFIKNAIANHENKFRNIIQDNLNNIN